ncbi:MAG: site-specific integrase [Pirellulales bacterium]|nr:site-specific integrase [Pirellulales bacterium]
MMDLANGAAVHVGEERGGDALLPLWRRLRARHAKIEAVATDMSPASRWSAWIIRHVDVEDHNQLARELCDRRETVSRQVPCDHTRTRPQDRLSLDFTGRRPMLRIPATLEKGNQDRFLPVSPEFAEFLLAVPKAERSGPVFDPKPRRVKGGRLQAHRVGELVAAIGKAAKIIVDRRPKRDPETGEVREVVKYASAHDLRRSFGERWAPRVMPQVLMELMRHESFETAQRYYVVRNARTTAEALWRADGENGASNTFGNSAARSSSANEKAPPQPIGTTGLVE